MAVSDWTSTRELESGWSRVFVKPQLVVLLEEEFEPDEADEVRDPLLGPLGPMPPKSQLIQAFASAYDSKRLVRLSA